MDGAPPERLVMPGSLELLADCAQMNAQLGTDLTQGPAVGVQVGCALNVHRATVTAARPRETKTTGSMNDYLLERGTPTIRPTP